MSDFTMRQHVLDELEFEPSVDAANIGVAIETGIGIPTGRVGSYAEKMAAEAAMWLVSGVWAIAEEIEVIHPERGKHADHQMAPRARRTGH